MVKSIKTERKIEPRKPGKYISLLASIIIIFSFYFHQYATIIPGVTLGELLAIFACVLVLIYKRLIIQIAFTKLLVLLYGIALISSIISLLISNMSFNMVSEVEVFSRWVRYFVYIAFYVMLCDNSLELFKSIDVLRLYRFFCIIISIYTVLQFVFYTVFHISLPNNILHIPFYREVVDAQMATNYYYRACGIFIEPSYLCTFLLPGLVFALFKTIKNKTDWIIIVLVTLAVFASTSLLGIFILVVTFIFFLLTNKTLSTKQLLSRSVTIILFVATLLLIYNSGVVSQAFGRISNIISFEGIGNMDRSSQLRLLRGFALWMKLPFEYKIFGVGMGNAANFSDKFGLVTSYDYYYRNAATLDYMNGISNIMVCEGIICFAIFVIFIIKIFKNSSKQGKLLLIQFLLVMFSGSALFSFTGIFFVFFVLYANQLEKFENSIKCS